MTDTSVVVTTRRNLLLLGAAAVVAIVFLAIGSVHNPTPSQVSRIAYLESVLKCPSCTDLSIGQSSDPVAQELDRLVVADVAAGQSNSQIETTVLAKYPGSIFEPRGGIGLLAVGIPTVALVIGAAAGLTLLLRRRRRDGPPNLETPLAVHGGEDG